MHLARDPTHVAWLGCKVKDLVVAARYDRELLVGRILVRKILNIGNRRFDALACRLFQFLIDRQVIHRIIRAS